MSDSLPTRLFVPFFLTALRPLLSFPIRHALYSHSIVAGGLDEMSYTTRFTPRTSLMIRFDMRPSTSYGMWYQSAVM